MADSNIQGRAQAPVVKKDPLAFLERAQSLPSHIDPKINLRGWASALILDSRYKEPHEGMMSRAALVNAMDEDDLFSPVDNSHLTKLGELVPNEPGKTSGLMVAYDIYVYPSSGNDGPPTYIDIWAALGAEEEEKTIRIGSRNVQAFYMKALCRGQFNIPHQITRTNTQIKGGEYMYAVVAA